MNEDTSKVKKQSAAEKLQTFSLSLLLFFGALSIISSCGIWFLATTNELITAESHPHKREHHSGSSLPSLQNASDILSDFNTNYAYAVNAYLDKSIVVQGCVSDVFTDRHARYMTEGCAATVVFSLSSNPSWLLIGVLRNGETIPQKGDYVVMRGLVSLASQEKQHVVISYASIVR